MTRQDKLVMALLRLRQLQSNLAMRALSAASGRHLRVVNAISDCDALLALEMADADPQTMCAWRAAIRARQGHMTTAAISLEREVAVSRQTLRDRLSSLEFTKIEADRRIRQVRRARLHKEQMDLDERTGREAMP